jgi:hypothetical protein
VNASEDGVYRLLRALGSVGLFAETGNRRFRLTRLGRLLRIASSQALGGYARFTGDQSTWRPWGELRHSVRTGEPAFDHVFEMPIALSGSVWWRSFGSRFNALASGKCLVCVRDARWRGTGSSCGTAPGEGDAIRPLPPRRLLRP